MKGEVVMDKNSINYLSNYISLTEDIKIKLRNMPNDMELRQKFVHGIKIGKTFVLTGVAKI